MTPIEIKDKMIHTLFVVLESTRKDIQESQELNLRMLKELKAQTEVNFELVDAISKLKRELEKRDTIKESGINPDMNTAELNFSVMTDRALAKAKIYFVGDIIKISEAGNLEKKFGPRVVKELRGILGKLQSSQ